MRPPIIGKTADGRSVVLNRFEGSFAIPPHVDPAWLQASAQRLRTGVVVDVETTGLELRVDPVIEIALRLFTYDVRTGEVVQAGERYASFEDPGVPIPALITELTGIRDDDVRGQRIDRARVAQLLSGAALIVAHNARFDRPRLEALLEGVEPARKAVWACSATNIDWTRKGFPSGKLEILSLYHGFFVDAHRAAADVDALLHLLTLRDHKGGQPYLADLLADARKDSVRVSAIASPIETKDVLRERRYRWHRDKKVWERVVREDDLPAERAWLEKHVYEGRCLATETKIPREQRFLEEED